jgi:hypothetical protein
VLGKRTMNATMIVEALEAKKWLPSSSDPRQYISYMLSSNAPDTFERTGPRGFYRVRGAKATAKKKVASKAAGGSSNGKKTTKKTAKKTAKKATKKVTKKTAKKAAKKTKAAKPDPQTDAKLGSMFDINTSQGPDVASDPHAEAGAS